MFNKIWSGIGVLGVAMLAMQCATPSNDSGSHSGADSSAIAEFTTNNNEEAMGTFDSHTIMFYNVENLFDTFNDPHTDDDSFLPDAEKEWTEKRFSKKISNLSDVIIAIDAEPPSVIGLVEIENKYVLEQLAGSAYIKNFNYEAVHHESPDERGIDVGFLYDTDKFVVQEHYPIPVTLPENDKTRDILYVRGFFKGEEQPFHFFVNHWPSRREGQQLTEPKRVLAAEQLKYHVEKIMDEERNPNIVIMGDFNDYPDSKSIWETLNARNHRKTKDTELFNLSYEMHMDDEGTYNYRGDWVMMDQMIISGNLLNNRNESFHTNKDGLNVFKEKWILYLDKKYKEYKPNKTYGGNNYYGGYSDHLPIYMKLKKSR